MTGLSPGADQEAENDARPAGGALTTGTVVEERSKNVPSLIPRYAETIDSGRACLVREWPPSGLPDTGTVNARNCFIA